MEEIKTTESTPAEWTKIEEMGLLGAKALNKTWKEISAALPGKNLEDIKKKYRELYVDAPANVKPKEAEGKKEETKETEDKGEKKEERKEEGKVEGKEEGKHEKVEEKKGEKKEEKSEDVGKDEAKVADETKKDIEGRGKKGGKAGKQRKKGQEGQRVQKGKETVEETKVGEAKVEEAKVEEVKSEERKGILKAKATIKESGKDGELKWIHGHPVIFVDDDEELDYEEVSLRMMGSLG